MTAGRFHRAASVVRARRYWLLLGLVVGLGYYAWTQVTRTRGAQEVVFRPASKHCKASGAVRYCIYRASAGTNGDILYHLHGRNLDEQIWNDDTYFTALVQAAWQRSGVRPPTVVTLSYGPSWLLAAKGERPDSGLLDDFIKRLPLIERALGAPRRRLLLGESMGGLNVLVAGLTYPKRFAKIAALCPGVYAVSPFASFGELRAAAARTGANPKIAFGVWMLARQHLANEREWQRFSPLALIERSDPTYPALYLSNGLYDAYGNFEGTERLARIAARRGVATQFRPLYGGHCSIDATSLASFLAS
ncbi:alpha/beta hydrolase-fold protein [Sphingomonas radiodurans]|uniref:alpha/beta hydrolase-fold protein n=1 Tax=Sphingomonas radiodurans TaxID=2890321 RepID=UPI001E3C6A54|nr:alpha/beta hydrolase-fold protein [Sphingomonas radiodurans]WBH17987.1 alpha/beta hydrolase-fold protein [Sphingomonas radiodurans]